MVPTVTALPCSGGATAATDAPLTTLPAVGRLDTSTPPLICIHSPAHDGPIAGCKLRPSHEEGDTAGAVPVRDGRVASSSSPVESDDPLAAVDEVEGGGGSGSNHSINLLSSTPATNGLGRRSPGGGGGGGGHHMLGSSGGEGSDGGEGSVNSLSSLPEGTFGGQARHKDGSLLQIVFQVGVVE